MILAGPFKEQVSLGIFTFDMIYGFAAMCVILVVIALCLIDLGLVRTKNVIDTVTVKAAGAMIAGLGTIFFGYAIWQWSFNSAFGVPDPLTQAIKDWWLFGPNVTNVPQDLDPKIVVEADIQMIFVVFFMTFSMATMALIHSAVVERIQGKPFLWMSAVVGLVLSPLAGYLCWGPVSPLTNRGVHDFDGVFPLYIFSGTFALVLAWRCRHRRGIPLGGVASAAERPPANVALVTVGVLLIVFALPFIAIGSGWFFPDVGFFGISMTTSGVGLVFMNILASFCTGGLVGTLIAYRRREAAWMPLGALSSAILCGAMFDVVDTWIVILCSIAGPFVTMLGQATMLRLGIDDQKVVPLALFNGAIGAVLTGFVAWGTNTGGFIGLEGKYGFQHAEITPWWQLVGVVAIMACAGIPALLMALFFERTTGLAVDDVGQEVGLDTVYWDPVPIPSAGAEPASPGAGAPAIP